MSQIVVSSCVTQLRRMLLTNHNLKRKIEDMEKKCEENDWVSRLRQVAMAVFVVDTWVGAGYNIYLIYTLED